MLSNFQLAKFSFHLKVQEPMHLPSYKGSTFRGAFGHAFKRIVCALKKETCEECLLKEKCIYSYVFETPVPADSEKMRKYPQSPHPFIIEPPLEGKRYYSPGETIIFNLIIIGRAIDYLPYFLYTFIELGKRGLKKSEGRYLLEEVKDNNQKTIYHYSDSILHDSFARLTFEDIIKQHKYSLEYFKESHDTQIADTIKHNEDSSLLNPHGQVLGKRDIIEQHQDSPWNAQHPQHGDINKHSITRAKEGFTTANTNSDKKDQHYQIKITFLTPTRIKYNEQFTLELEFHVLIRNLLRRISLLSYFHCGEELDIDFRGIIERVKAITTLSTSLRWHDWERYSNRQKTRMKLGGFIGEVTYTGDITPFWPFIKLGEFIHVGKGSTFGLGQYEAEVT